MVLPSTRGTGNEHLLSAISPCYYLGPLTMNEVRAELSTNHRELHVKGSDELAAEPLASQAVLLGGWLVIGGRLGLSL